MSIIEQLCAAGKASRSQMREPRACKMVLRSSGEVAIPHAVNVYTAKHGLEPIIVWSCHYPFWCCFDFSETLKLPVK